MQALPSVTEILPDFGVDAELPLLGWVFEGVWARKNMPTINGFLQASNDAKAIMQTSDTEWERLRSKVKPANDAEMVSIREAYREGIPGPLSEANITAARQVFSVLAATGGKELAGNSTELADGVFWDSFSARD